MMAVGGRLDDSPQKDRTVYQFVGPHEAPINNLISVGI